MTHDLFAFVLQVFSLQYADKWSSLGMYPFFLSSILIVSPLSISSLPKLMSFFPDWFDPEVIILELQLEAWLSHHWVHK